MNNYHIITDIIKYYIITDDIIYYIIIYELFMINYTIFKTLSKQLNTKIFYT
jgi:hypothetical protein